MMILSRIMILILTMILNRIIKSNLAPNLFQIFWNKLGAKLLFEVLITYCPTGDTKLIGEFRLNGTPGGGR